MSIFPFSMPGNKEAGGKKRDEENLSSAKFEQKLSEYRDTLEKYRHCIANYAGKFDGIDKRSMDNQLSITQIERDLAYIKDLGEKMTDLLEELMAIADTKANDNDSKVLAQGDKMLGQIESLTAAIIETNYKMDGMDKNVIGRLSDILLELQKQTLFQYKQNMTEIQTSLGNLTKAVKRNKVWGILSFILQILGLGALAFIILYLLEIIII